MVWLIVALLCLLSIYVFGYKNQPNISYQGMVYYEGSAYYVQAQIKVDDIALFSSSDIEINTKKKDCYIKKIKSELYRREDNQLYQTIVLACNLDKTDKIANQVVFLKMKGPTKTAFEWFSDSWKGN